MIKCILTSSDGCWCFHGAAITYPESMRSSVPVDYPREAGGKASTSISEFAREVWRQYRNKYLQKYLHASFKTEDEVVRKFLLITLISDSTTVE